MKAQELKSIAIVRLANCKTADLIDQLEKLNKNLSDGADLVMDAILSILMERMSEDDFNTICENL